MDADNYIDKFNRISAPAARKIIEQKQNPTIVNFETRTLCNSTCSFCPVSIQNEVRDDTSMTTDIFEKICDDLRQKDFSGILSFQLNNEPLIDKNLLLFLEIAKKQLPACRKKITTNGLTLTLDKAVELVESGVTILLVDNYSDSAEQYSRLQLVDRTLSEKYPDVLVKIQYDRSVDENLNTRGGRTKTQEKFESSQKSTMSEIGSGLDFQNDKIDYPCYRPFSSLTITTDGSVGLCCYDVYFELKIGNVFDDNVVDTWHNSKAGLVRRELIKGNRRVSDVCSKCTAEYLNDFELKKMGLSILERERN